VAALVIATWDPTTRPQEAKRVRLKYYNLWAYLIWLDLVNWQSVFLSHRISCNLHLLGLQSDYTTKRSSIAVNATPSHSYGTSLAIGDHAVLPATRHKRTRPALTSAMQAGTRFAYPGGMEGWVDPVALIAPRPGIEQATFRSRAQRLTTAPPRLVNLTYYIPSPF